jgi:hypothetical protein
MSPLTEFPDPQDRRHYLKWRGRRESASIERRLRACAASRTSPTAGGRAQAGASVRDARRSTPSPRARGEGGMRGPLRESELGETPPHRAEFRLSAVLAALSQTRGEERRCPITARSPPAPCGTPRADRRQIAPGAAPPPRRRLDRSPARPFRPRPENPCPSWWRPKRRAAP